MERESLDQDQLETLLRNHMRETLPVPNAPAWREPVRSDASRTRGLVAGLFGVTVTAAVGITAVVALLNMREPPSIEMRPSPGSDNTNVGPRPTPASTALEVSPMPEPSNTGTVEPIPSTSAPSNIQEAIELALTDPELTTYLAQHLHGDPIGQIYSYSGAAGQLPAILVTIDFLEFADDYPLGSCDTYREIDHVVGVAWLIDDQADEILARSPIWPGNIRCV